MLFSFQGPGIIDPGHASPHLAVMPGFTIGFWLAVACLALTVIVFYALKNVAFRPPDRRLESNRNFPAGARELGKYPSLAFPTESPAGPGSTVSLSPDPYGINHVDLTDQSASPADYDGTIHLLPG